MNSLLVTLNNSMPLFFTLAVVLWLRKKGIFKPSLAQALSPLIFKFTLPLFAFNVIYNLTFNPSDWVIVLAIFSANLLLLPIIVLTNQLTKFKKPLLGSLLLLSLSYSVGPVGYPFVQLNFEPEIFSKLVSIDIVLFVTIMVIGPIIAAIFDQTQKTNFKQVAKSVVTDPVLVAVTIAAFLNYLHIQLPNPLTNSFEFIGNSFILLVTVFMGLSLQKPDSKRIKLLTLITILRLLFALTLSYIIIQIFKPNTAMALAIPLTLFMAFSSFPLVYTQKHKLDSEIVIQASIFSRIFVFIFYPILITFLKQIYL